ncbi:ATP-binding protein [Streptomyces sp. RS10V-4]|uniref:ATP-binding protein n=1 Tax=Streptomyces rhizoryzae TaxID=2932493 RepID=UPI0020050BDA|nr:ATP-binding protein [Streptomyces rhizoryzae]MCK7622514.1 ATP-binding protein [Streptomyces rhizoryzae]
MLMETAFLVSERPAGQLPPSADLARVRHMRKCVRAALGYYGLTPMSDDVALVVSELVGNAIVHNVHGPEITVRLQVVGRNLELRVSHTGSCRPALRTPSGDAESGRGLPLVDGIARGRGGSWMVHTSSSLVTVRCSLPLDGAEE